jgi:predicted glycogen debranching enzyme
LEWLVTNGLGGYAASTVTGLNTRKYHGLLVAALNPPGDRTVCLAKLDEDLLIGNKTVRLGVNEFQDHSIFPSGYQRLCQFTLNPLPTFTYTADKVTVKKTVALAYGKNLAVTLYEIKNRDPADATFRVYPLVTCRHFHDVVNREALKPQFSVKQTNLTVKFTCSEPQAEILLRASGGKFVERPVWVDGVFYREEAARGEADTDRYYQPGYYELALAAGAQTSFGVVAAASKDFHADAILNSVGSKYADFSRIAEERWVFNRTF